MVKPPLLPFILMMATIASYGAELPSSGTYMAFGKSMFDFTGGTNAYMSGGVPVSYPVEISFDGNGSAVISGLLGPRNDFEDLKGTYDQVSGTIDFTTPPVEITSIEPYHSLGKTDGYDNLLCAFRPYGIGYMEPKEKLELKFSADGRTIYPSSGFGAGIVAPLSESLFRVADYEEALYDMILLRREEGVSFNIDSRFADITNTYPGTTVVSTFRIYNTGSEESEFVVASSSPLFTVLNPAGSLKPGEFSDVRVSFVTPETGDFATKLTVTNESCDTEFEIKATCVPLPDYGQIVKEGEMVFSTDPAYPWLISDKYGDSLVAVNSNSGQEMTTSSLYADFSVSERNAAVLSWKGFCDPRIPRRDLFVVSLDGEDMYMSQNEGGATDSSIRIAPGNHRVTFSYVKGPLVNGSFALGRDFAWIKDLTLTESPIPAASGRLSSEKINFPTKNIVRGVASDESTVYLVNEGYEPLTVLEAASDNANFSAVVSSEPISTFEVIPVIVRFHASEAGDHSGKITLRTSAGDMMIACSGKAAAVPDYSPIVAKGDFWFDTTILNPFVVEGNKAYNSTSMKKDRKQTVSMLQAMFEVPEGYYGELTWNARVSSASSGQEMVDYATIYIDGEEVTQNYYGEMDVNQVGFSPSQVNFYPGEHFIAFSYTQGGDAKYEGDDRIEVSGLSLDLKKMPDDEVRPWGEPEAVFQDVYVSKAYSREVKLANFGSRPLKVLSATATGPFTAEIDPDRLYNTFEEVSIPVSFIPEKAGTEEGELLIRTSGGDVKVKCRAEVVNSPDLLLIEDFEDDMRLWSFIDLDGDGISWDLTTSPMNAFHGQFALQTFSIHADFSEEPLDDVALSPEFTVPAEGAELSFYLACYNTTVADRLEILAGEGEDPTGFETVETLDLLNIKSYYNQYKVDLDGFAGRRIRLALRHRLETPLTNFIAIDDLLVTSKGVDGIDAMTPDEILSIDYYTLDGLKAASPGNGIYLKRTRFADGSVKTEKVGPGL